MYQRKITENTEKHQVPAASLGELWTTWTSGSTTSGFAGCFRGDTGLPVGTFANGFLVSSGLTGFLGCPGFLGSDKESLTGFLATGGPLLGARGLPVSLLGETLAVAFSGTGALPGGVCFLATTSDTLPLVLFNMATACNKVHIHHTQESQKT